MRGLRELRGLSLAEYLPFGDTALLPATVQDLRLRFQQCKSVDFAIWGRKLGEGKGRGGSKSSVSRISNHRYTIQGSED